MTPTCSACRLPADVRLGLAEMHRRGLTIREIAQRLADVGHPVHRDAVHRHLRQHVAPDDESDPGDLDARIALLVDGAGAVLEKWPSRAIDIAQRWLSDGAEAEAARLVQRAVPSLMQNRFNKEAS